MRKGFSKFLGVGLILLLVDAFTKYLVLVRLNLSSISYSPFYPYGGVGIFQDFFGIDFCITKVTNFGSAWGIFSSHPSVLLIVRMGILLSLFVYTCFINNQKRRRLPLFLIIVGATGNILDSWIYGFVIDMLHFNLWGYSFPVFNLADSMIFLGIFSLIFQSFFQRKHGTSLSKRAS